MSNDYVIQKKEGAEERNTGFLKSKLTLLLAALLPIIVLAGMVYWFTSGGSRLIETSTVPVERLDFERIVLQRGKIVAYLRNTGPTEVTVAQVTVNEALWEASIEPSNVIPRLGRATITIPYHWVEGEPYEITVITSTGLKFTGKVEIATLTPTPSLRYFGTFALLGIYVGVIPVYLGIMWLPFLRRMSKKWLDFFLSLTAGLLVFLGIDTMEEAFEVAGRIPDVFQGIALIAIGVGVSLLGLTAVSQKTTGRNGKGESSYDRLALAYMIALGIGLHNLGEGLAIGAAYVVGEIALGAFLVIGFAVHNITEGLAIVAPISRDKIKNIHLLFMGFIAGFPAVVGTWIGGFTYSQVLAILFFALGAGAIFQVVYKLIRLILRETEGEFVNVTNFIGLIVGFLIMYITALFVVA